MSKLAQAGASSTTPAGFAIAYAISTASPIDAATRTGTTPASASATSAPGRRRGAHRPRRPNRAPRPPPAPERPAQQPGVAALDPPADDRHEVAVEALDRPQRRLDVRRLRIVDEPDAAGVGHQFHRVFE